MSSQRPRNAAGIRNSTLLAAVDYALTPHVGPTLNTGRVVPPRPSNLRTGGGRKDRPGWTPHKLRENRARFNSLRPWIKTGVTISYPEKASPEQLIDFNISVREFCKEKGFPARSIWEGPRKHHHIALGIEFDPDIERAWKARLQRRWLKIFGEEMPSKAFRWDPDIRPDEIASYLLKTKKNGIIVKGSFPWLTFNPIWETGFRMLSKPSEKQGQKSPSQYSSEKRGEVSVGLKPRKMRGMPSTVQMSEKKGETSYSGCPSCWSRWVRSLWRRACECEIKATPCVWGSLGMGGDLHPPVRASLSPAFLEDQSTYAP